MQVKVVPSHDGRELPAGMGKAGKQGWWTAIRQKMQWVLFPDAEEDGLTNQSEAKSWARLGMVRSCSRIRPPRLQVRSFVTLTPRCDRPDARWPQNNQASKAEESLLPLSIFGSSAILIHFLTCCLYRRSPRLTRRTPVLPPL